jgi:flagellar biosynthesis protein FlhF
MHDLSGGGVTTSFRSQEKAKGEPKPITSQKYIDIDNDHQEDERSHENIRQAVMRARNAFNDNDEVVNNRNENSNAPKESSFGSKLFKKQAVALPQIQETTQASNQELDYLREEIKNLKSVLTNFKEIPQTFSGTFPGAGFGIPFEMSYMFEKLTHTGMAPEVVSEILREGQREIGPSRISNKALVEAFVARYILNHVKVADTAHQDKIQIFMGVAGAGKTSSLIKFASHLVVHEGKKVALLTADTQKVGAAEQLKIFAQILNVPFGIIRSVEDWNMIIKQLAKFDHILVDFPSSSLKTEAEVQRMRNLLPPRSVKTTNHLVMNALKKDFDSTEIGKRYRSFNYEDVIFTALDESHTHGTIYNFIHRFQVPVHSFGMGVRIPEDFEMGSAERILDLIFKITHEGQV